MEPYKQLESEYASFVGSRYAVAVSSGTAGLHLALLSLGVKAGDEVIIPDFTMAACAFAVSYVGAKPVFADVSRDTYAILPEEIERCITDKTKAIMAVHVYGRLAPMKEILQIAHARGIPVIEDACEAQGAIYASKADITVYSLYRNKIIASEEGGIVTTNTRRIAERIAYLKNMTFDKGHTYFHADIGFNYRLADCLAIIALQSLHKYEQNAIKRREIEAVYNKFLPMPRRDAVWFYEVFVPETAKKMILKNVPAARESFKPLSTFPMYGARRGRPNALQLSRTLILLPVSIELSLDDVRHIASRVNEILIKPKKSVAPPTHI